MRTDLVMTTEYRHGENHVYRSVAGEHLLISLKRTDVYPLLALTPTAAELWQILDDWRAAHDLVTHLVQRYDVTSEEAEADVAVFLEQMAEIGTLDEREGAE